MTAELTQGVDISKHQGTMDLDQDGTLNELVEAGFHFCFVKATEGATYIDPKFFANWRLLAETPGMMRGAYHFARPDNRPRPDGGREEAEHFLRTINKAHDIAGALYDGCVLPPVLDFEKYTTRDHTDGGEHGYTILRPWIEGWLDVVEREFGCRCIVYTGRKIWRYETGIPKGGEWTDLGWLADRADLWLVQYSERGAHPGLGARYPISRWPWKFWQWSGGGDLAFHPKVAGRVVDVNRFRGSLEDLRAMAMRPWHKSWHEPAKPQDGGAQRIADSLVHTTKASVLLGQSMAQPLGDAKRTVTRAIAEMEAALALLGDP